MARSRARVTGVVVVLDHYPDRVPVQGGSLCHRVGSSPSAVARAVAGLICCGVVAALVLIGNGSGEAMVPNASNALQQTRQKRASAIVGTEWRFDVLTTSGDRWVVPSDVDAVLRFNGTGGFSGQACNYFGGPVTIASRVMTFGPEIDSTAIGCLGDGRRAEVAVLQLLHARPTWSLANGDLRLTSPGVTAELRKRDAVFPTRDLVVLSASRPGDVRQWQFGYQAQGDGSVFLTWEGRSRAGEPWGNAGMVVTGLPTDAMAVRFGRDTFVFGYVAPGAVSARYEPSAGTSRKLGLHELPIGRSVVGQYVPAGEGQVVAFDASGSELSRTRHLPG
jgi:heat shock protein HslJ